MTLCASKSLGHLIKITLPNRYYYHHNKKVKLNAIEATRLELTVNFNPGFLVKVHYLHIAYHEGGNPSRHRNKQQTAMYTFFAQGN